MNNMDNPEVKNKVDKYDMDAAIKDMTDILGETAELFHKLKKTKFNYLVQTCEIYTRVDYPSIMVDVCDKEVKQMIPTARDIRSGEF